MGNKSISKMVDNEDEWAKEKQYEDFLEFVNISGQVDSDYAYPKIQKTC